MPPLHSPYKDFPSNDIRKSNYKLDFFDEFIDTKLDETRWVKHHLPQWSSKAQSAAHYSLVDSHLALKINAQQEPWCPEYDGDIRCSSIQTGVFSGAVNTQIGQHRFNKSSVVREEQAIKKNYVTQYGYFEIRAKCNLLDDSNVAFWLIGFEELTEDSSEICVCDIFSKHMSHESTQIGMGVHPFHDPRVEDDFKLVNFPIDASEFHIYAVDWSPQKLVFYIDNQEVFSTTQSPSCPMQIMLGLYDRSLNSTNNDLALASQQFVIDYVRAYKAVG